MASFTFRGFAQTSSVAISAVQGSRNASGSVPTWGQSSLAELTFDYEGPAELVAPAGIWFAAAPGAGFGPQAPSSGTYDPRFHEITYVWDFDDPGAFANPHLNIPAAWNEKGIDYGPYVYHVFDTPGTYDVRCWAIDAEGNWGEQVRPITILDPEAVFTGTRTVCVSQTGDFTDAPTGALTRTTPAAAFEVVRTFGQSARILFRAGETWPAQQIEVPRDVPHGVRVGRFGTGANPLFRPPEVTDKSLQSACFRFAKSCRAEDVVFSGLDFQGDWDGTTETGDGRMFAVQYHLWDGSARHNFLMYRCSQSGFHLQDLGQGGQPGAPIYAIVDSHVTNWQNMGIWVPGYNDYAAGKRVAIVGCSVHHPEHVCKGGHGKIGLGIEHGCYRDGSAKETLISASSFYSGGSWFSTGVQACVRLHTDGSEDIPTPNPGDQRSNVTRCVMEGGSAILNAISVDAGSETRPGNTLIDRVVMITDYETANFFHLGFGGTTIRNALLNRIRDVSFIGSPGFVENLFMEMHDDDQNGNQHEPVHIHNYTFHNQSSEVFPEHGTVFTTTPFTNLIIEDRLWYEPNLAVPNVDDGPVTLTDLGIKTFNKGYRAGPQKVSLSLAAAVAVGDSMTMPYPEGLGQIDFGVGMRHTLKVGNTFLYAHRGDIAVTFNPTDITVQNMRASTWAAGTQVILALHQDTIATDVSRASPTTVSLPVPTPGAGAADDSVAKPYDDILGAVRPGQGPAHTGGTRPSGSPDRGAAET